MATRAVIQVEGIDYVELYKHWDGYSEATLEWLKTFNSDFEENRSHDPEYKFAQLIRSSERDSSEFGLDTSKYIGWGVLPFNSECGATYKYILKNDGTVVVEEL